MRTIDYVPIAVPILGPHVNSKVKGSMHCSSLSPSCVPWGVKDSPYAHLVTDDDKHMPHAA